MRYLLGSFVLLGLLCAGSNPLHAQALKDLTPDDYHRWYNTSFPTLSPDGEWMAYNQSWPEETDTLYVRNRNGSMMHKLEHGSMAEFSEDNQWLAYRIGVSAREAIRMREQNKPVEYKLGLLHLPSGRKAVIQNISRFDFSRNGKFLAVQLAPPKDNKDKGSVLLLRNLTDSSTRTIGNVTEYAFNKKSDYLAYVVESANKAGNTVELFHLPSYVVKVLASDTLRFSRLNWSKEGEALAYYKTFTSPEFEEDNAWIYFHRLQGTQPVTQVLNPGKTAGIPDRYRVSPTSSLSISDDAKRVFFGVRPWTAKPAKETTKPAKDSGSAKPVAGGETKAPADSAKTAYKKPEVKPAPLDIWHWKDREIQPRQKITYNQDKDASLLSVWNTGNNSVFRLQDSTDTGAQLNGDQTYAVAWNDKPYKPAFKEDYIDIYLVNTTDGSRKRIAEKFGQNGFSTFLSWLMSPGGRYLAYFQDRHWFSYDVQTGKHTNLTEKISVPFWNTRYDGPSVLKPSWGVAGFTKGDREFWVYDEYNLYALKPDGSGHRKITDGEKEEIMYRYARLDFEVPYIDDSQPVYLSTMGDKSKKFGYARLEKGKVTPLIWEDRNIRGLQKAKNSNLFFYTRQDYNLPPQYLVNDGWKKEEMILQSNPQHFEYRWGKSEIINYTNAKGQKLQGALYYPDNYEPGKQYPMIVYIYELLSNNVHSYVNPSHINPYNTTNFTSTGYFVFTPDIVYDLNDPGMSAVNCVVPAVETVLKTGMIDRKRLGLTGHSWGAYQTSFIITQTKLFSAAVAGAPLTDLISMSLSIYWNTGTPDQKIFETSQGRFDGPWYERMQEHMRNSPIFNAQNIETPILVAFGDKDGAVDWHQGIEFYGTLRRMQKPHIMLVYADENHGLNGRETRIDYRNRQQEYFDHYLQGKPAPRWITDGVTYLERMKEKEKSEKK